MIQLVRDPELRDPSDLFSHDRIDGLTWEKVCTFFYILIVDEPIDNPVGEPISRRVMALCTVVIDDAYVSTSKLYMVVKSSRIMVAALSPY